MISTIDDTTGYALEYEEDESPMSSAEFKAYQWRRGYLDYFIYEKPQSPCRCYNAGWYHGFWESQRPRKFTEF
jgi:hypothetical protein